MAVLRCPYCGRTVREGDRFCSHCGEEFDRPVVDQYWSGKQEGLSGLLKLLGLCILWIVIGTIVNAVFISSTNEWFIIGLTTAITAIIAGTIHYLK